MEQKIKNQSFGEVKKNAQNLCNFLSNNYDSELIINPKARDFSHPQFGTTFNFGFTLTEDYTPCGIYLLSEKQEIYIHANNKKNLKKIEQILIDKKVLKQ